jgi:hypothetical protein
MEEERRQAAHRMHIFDAWPAHFRKATTQYAPPTTQIQAVLDSGFSMELVLRVLRQEQEEDDAKPPGS